MRIRSRRLLMTDLDSKVATDFVPSHGFKKGAYRTRPRGACSIVVHTTGAGPWARVESKRHAAWRAKFPQFADTTFNAAKWLYMYGATGRSGPHYLVGQDGEVCQLCPEIYAAWHVGSKGSAWYKLPAGQWHSRHTKWWKARFPGKSSPRQLRGGLLWKGGSCNNNTIGIEVAPPRSNPRAKWSDEAWEALVALVDDIATRNDIPMTHEGVLTHSDCHPRARSARGKPWDTNPDQFTWMEFKRRVSSRCTTG